MIIWCWTYSSRSSLNWERLRNSRRTRKNVLQWSHEWINMYAAYYHMVFVHGKAAERFLKIMSYGRGYWYASDTRVGWSSKDFHADHIVHIMYSAVSGRNWMIGVLLLVFLSYCESVKVDDVSKVFRGGRASEIFEGGAKKMCKPNNLFWTITCNNNYYFVRFDKKHRI